MSAGSTDARVTPVYYQLVQYPQAGVSGFYGQIDAARRSIDMEMYELDDRSAEAALAAAAARGVRVRVLLDRDYHGATVNTAAYRYLKSHRVEVRWAPAGYIFHIKTTVFDGRTADVSTGNLTSHYYADTRDAELIDTNPVQVSAIEATFDNDWDAAPGGDPATQTVQAPGLVWSPETGDGSAERSMVRVIDGARRSIDFESEELSDPAIYDALAAVARHHVSCRVVMTDDPEWDPAFNVLLRAGCAVHLLADADGTLYIHEKAIIVDPGTPAESLLLGSQNASYDSLTRNRELSLSIMSGDGGAEAITAAARTFTQDFGAGRPLRSLTA